MAVKVNMQKILSEFDSMIELNGSDTEFTLRGGGTQFVIKSTDISRQESALTDGLPQPNAVIRVMAARWHGGAGAGREPEKGDRVVVGARKFRVENARLAQFQGASVGYVMVLRG